MHVENQSQQVSIRFNPVAPIAPGHCFYFIIFMNQIYQRALLETTSLPVPDAEKSPGRWLRARRSKGVRTCRDWKWPIDMAMGQKPRCWTFKILGHIGPICCTIFLTYTILYRHLYIYMPYIIYIFALSLPSGSHPPMPGYQEQLWYRWLLPGFFMIPEGSFRRSQKRPMLKYDLNMGLSENRVYSQL